jgi:hypothetical protein
MSLHIQEYSSGSFVGLGGCGKCILEFGLGHFVAVGYARNRWPASPKFFATQKNPVGNPPLFPPPPFREFMLFNRKRRPIFSSATRVHGKAAIVGLSRGKGNFLLSEMIT